MNTESTKPLVGVICDIQTISPHLFHVAGDKYLRALSQAADVIPVLIPCLQNDQNIEHWLSRIDGVFLTGAYSMVDPVHYGESRIDADYGYDSGRDELSFQLINGVKQRDIPLLGVCRGFQDINVAFGGSLHQAVQDVPGLMDHREDKNASLEEQYAPVHAVTVSANGLLNSIIPDPEFMVNSLHSQGINRLGTGLTAEAFTQDGLIEALSINDMTFGLAVQWHPEWKVMQNPTQKRLFEAFGNACRKRLFNGN